ncbi:hypothetical protein V6N13_098905 [Hibiscus sabdariffa]
MIVLQQQSKDMAAEIDEVVLNQIDPFIFLNYDVSSAGRCVFVVVQFLVKKEKLMYISGSRPYKDHGMLANETKGDVEGAEHHTRFIIEDHGAAVDSVQETIGAD